VVYKASESLRGDRMARAVSMHDKFFRKSMQNVKVAKDFFKANLPQNILKRINLETLALAPGSFLDAQLKESISDIVYSVKTQDGLGYLTILVEHQSTPQKMMAFRMIKYVISIMDMHLRQGSKTLPLVYPLLIYHGKITPYPCTCDLFDLFDNPITAKELMFKPFHLIDLNQVPDEKIKDFGLATIMTLVLKYIFTGEILPAIQLLSKWGAFTAAEQAMLVDYLHAMIEYILKKAETQGDSEVVTQLLSHEILSERDNIMNIAQQIKEKGKLEGIQQGMQQGIQQGMQQGIQQGMQQGMQQGIKQGTYQRDVHIVQHMLKKGLSESDISTYTDIPLEVIQTIKAQHQPA
jgi:predicted transposase/invertase (TIGR01784 family)